MEPAQTQVFRVQDRLIDFFRSQTSLSIRLSENLQDLSRNLLDRIRKVMEGKLPLLGKPSLDNTTIQTIFQVVSAVAIAGLKSKSIQLGSLASLKSVEMGPVPGPTAGQTELSRYQRLSHEKHDFETTQLQVSSFTELTGKTSDAFMTMLKGRGDTYTFNSDHLRGTHEETKTCQRNTQEAQALLASTIKQIIAGH